MRLPSLCFWLTRPMAAKLTDNNKKRSLAKCKTSLLGYPDSNQERQDQNLQCYHYTIAQCSNAMQRYNKSR